MSEDTNKVTEELSRPKECVADSVDLFNFLSFKNTHQYEEFFVLRPIMKLVYEIHPSAEDVFKKDVLNGTHYTWVEDPDVPGDIRVVHGIVAENTGVNNPSRSQYALLVQDCGEVYEC